MSEQKNPTKAHAPVTTAIDFLICAGEKQTQRAAEYDQPGGERSMAMTVQLFNTATALDLSESDGWLFMAFLKLVREQSRVGGHQDSRVDLVSYSSLYAEARAAGK